MEDKDTSFGMNHLTVVPANMESDNEKTTDNE